MESGIARTESANAQRVTSVSRMQLTFLRLAEKERKRERERESERVRE